MSRGLPELTDSRKEEILNAFDKLFQVRSFRNISMRGLQWNTIRILCQGLYLTVAIMAQMWRSTGEEKYLTKLEGMTVGSGLDSANFGDYGNIAIVTMENIDHTFSVYINAKNAIINRADTYVRNAEKNPYGFSVVNHYKGGWGSNMTAAS